LNVPKTNSHIDSPKITLNFSIVPELVLFWCTRCLFWAFIHVYIKCIAWKNWRILSVVFSAPYLHAIMTDFKYMSCIESRASIYPKKWGDGLKTRKVRRYATRIFLTEILIRWNGIPSVIEALIKLYYNVHDLKSIFNHVKNPIKPTCPGLWTDVTLNEARASSRVTSVHRLTCVHPYFNANNLLY
jgi:hypothetical protein